MVWSESDIMDLIMQGRDIATLSGLITDATVDQTTWLGTIDPMPNWSPQQEHNCTVPD